MVKKKVIGFPICHKCISQNKIACTQKILFSFHPDLLKYPHKMPRKVVSSTIVTKENSFKDRRIRTSPRLFEVMFKCVYISGCNDSTNDKGITDKQASMPIAAQRQFVFGIIFQFLRQAIRMPKAKIKITPL